MSDRTSIEVRRAIESALKTAPRKNLFPDFSCGVKDFPAPRSPFGGMNL
jgi:hypothetical protein